jgi:hypothetical protein
LELSPLLVHTAPIVEERSHVGSAAQDVVDASWV